MYIYKKTYVHIICKSREKYRSIEVPASAVIGYTSYNVLEANLR